MTFADDLVCAKCGSKSRSTHTHHIDFNHYNDAPENLLLLCFECHKALHNKKWSLEDIGIVSPKKYNTVPYSKISEKQERAIKEIENITEHFGKDRWFIQEEVVGAGYKTLMALVNKGVLVTKYFGSKDYYQLIPKVTIKTHKMVPAKE